MNQGTEFSIDFAQYYDYQELSEILSGLAEAYADLARLCSIGQSHQGRDLWLLEITGRDTGRENEKPGYYIDGNTHPEEIAGSTVALHTAWYLLNGYGKDEMVTRLVDRRVFYILPRLNPDGAEICLKKAFYKWVGNGRYRPGEEQRPEDGLHYKDINGDGYILHMRWRDPMGEWKISERDPRLMVQRAPDDYGGEYYRLVPEGEIWNYDGADITVAHPREGNMNRNYPFDWGPEGEQYGAGEYPMSEPEIAAVVEFIKAHPNIAGALNYHTHAGAILAPFGVRGKSLPFEDHALFKRIGEMGEEETGYRFVSKEEEFNLPGHPRRRGTSDAFLYGQLGIVSFVTELWDVYAEAGIEKDWVFPLRELSEDDSLRLLNWNDQYLDGEGFMDWSAFEHPQLGEVQIGGWRKMFTFRNPPGQLLEKTCRKNTLFTLRHAAAAPEVHIGRAEAIPLEGQTFRVSVVIENWGYLSTNLTKRAIDMGVAKPVIARIELGERVGLDSGNQEVELGHLAGRSTRPRNPRYLAHGSTWEASSRKAEWVIRFRGQGTSPSVRVVAVSEKGGVDTKSICLGGGGLPG